MGNWQSLDLDQMQHTAASDQDLHCLLIVQPFFCRNVYIIKPGIPKIKNEHQHIVREFI